jgi:hypothetical protein
LLGGQPMLICLAVTTAARDPYFVSTLAYPLGQVLVHYLFHLANSFSVVGPGRAELKASSVSTRFAIVIRLVVQQNGDARLRESLSHSTGKSALLQYSPHDGQECQQAVPARDAPRCGQLPTAKSETALRRPGMGINAISSGVGRYEILCPSFSNSSRSA